MSRHGHSSPGVLTTLLAVITWAAMYSFGAWPVPGRTPSPEPAALAPAPSAQLLQNRLYKATSFEPEQYRHEHERLTPPSTYEEREQERERAALASRSALRPRIDDLAPAQFRPLVLKVAAHYDLDPRLLAAMVTYESKWRVDLIGPARDSGLMQIIPSTAEWIARKMGLKEYNVLDPETNLMMGAWYLAALLEKHGDVETALIEYNGGAAALNHPRGWDPHKYAYRVLSIRDTGRYDP